MRTLSVPLTVAAGLLAAACSSSPPSPQVVAGRIEQASFPTPITAVRVMDAAATVTESLVAGDGSFSLTIPPGHGYRITLVSADRPGLVFPRQSGTVEVAFAVRNGTTPFDLGMVRFVGDPTSRAYQQRPAGGVATADQECEDGVDATTGAVCVDDNDEEGAGVCEGDGGVNCEDGIDPATGAACDGGPAANQDDGTEAGDGEADDDTLPGQAAVADHNLPAAIGCSEGQGD